MRNVRIASTVFLLASLVSACAGGGGGKNEIAPCCNATGQTEQPSSAFAGAPSGALMAEAVVFPADACLATDDATGRIIVPETARAVSETVQVGADGRYSVHIDGNGTGEQVYIRIFDAEQPERTYGVAAVPTTLAGGMPEYHVAPIEFDRANPRLMGESTLEVRTTCLFRESIANGDMTIPDVRGAITRGLAADYDPEAVGAESRLMEQVLDWQHPIDDLNAGIAGTDPDAMRGNFAMLREMAQCNVCFCRDGAPVGNGRVSCDAAGDQDLPEFVRGWTLLYAATDFGVDLGRPIREPVLAWGFDLEKRVASATEAQSADAIEMARQARMLRFEAVDQAVLENAAGLGVSAGGVTAIETAMDAFRAPLITSTTSGSFAAAWESGPATAVWAAVTSDLGLELDGCVTSLLSSSIAGAANVPWTVAGVDDVTHATILDDLFAPTTGLRADIDAQASACQALSDPAERAQWADLLLYLSVNAVPIR